MIITKANISDLGGILELQKLCYTDNAKRYNNFSIAPMTQTLAEMEKEYSSSIILKAAEDNKIIGSVRAYSKDETCHVGRLIVHPNFQNKGIGKTLMNNIEKFYPKVKFFELFTGYKDDKNLYLYKKLGYVSFNEVEIDGTKLIYLNKKNIQN